MMAEGKRKRGGQLLRFMKVVQCSVCDRTFKTKFGIARHTRIREYAMKLFQKFTVIKIYEEYHTGVCTIKANVAEELLR